MANAMLSKQATLLPSSCVCDSLRLLRISENPSRILGIAPDGRMDERILLIQRPQKLVQLKTCRATSNLLGAVNLQAADFKF